MAVEMLPYLISSHIKKSRRSSPILVDGQAAEVTGRGKTAGNGIRFDTPFPLTAWVSGLILNPTSRLNGL